MRKKFLIALIALVAFLSPMPSTDVAWAAYKYRFDDLLQPSGLGAQWMVVGSMENPSPDNNEVVQVSRGGTTSPEEAIGGEDAVIDTEGTFVNSREHVYSTNGWWTVPLNDHDNNYEKSTIPMPIDYIFMVVPNGSVGINVDFKWSNPGLNHGDVFTNDIRITDDDYFAVKDAMGPVSGDYTGEPNGPLANRFHFDLSKKTNRQEYETVRTYMTFHQNPGLVASQTENIPLVIASVSDGDATNNPLGFHTVVREGSSRGPIVASDHFNWDVTSDRNFGIIAGRGANNQWTFVPLDNNSNDEMVYYLTTHVRNYTSVRYALQRYDRYSNAVSMSAQRWTMDLPPNVDDPELNPPSLPLDELSHIAPGMITTYTQNYNARSGGAKIFKIYPVDSSQSSATPRDLRWEHRVVQGVSLGKEDGPYLNQTWDIPYYSVQGFEYIPGNTAFLKNAAAPLRDPKSKANISVMMPNPEQDEDLMENAEISDATGVTTNAPSAVKIRVPVPPRLQYRSQDSHPVVGLLPLHLTFNLPKGNQYVARKWNGLLEAWEKDRNFLGKFLNSFRLCMRASDGDQTEIDLSRWLFNRELYESNVKVFMDEENQCITVSVIVMLVNSKEGSPSVTLLTDDKLDGGGTTRKYLTIWDRNNDTTWDMTFYVAYTDTDANPTEYLGDTNNLGEYSSEYDLRKANSTIVKPGNFARVRNDEVDLRYEWDGENWLVSAWSDGGSNSNDGGGGGGCNAGCPLAVGLLVTALYVFRNRKDGDER